MWDLGEAVLLFRQGTPALRVYLVSEEWPSGQAWSVTWAWWCEDVIHYNLLPIRL